jgi:hypothetical protein
VWRAQAYFGTIDFDLGIHDQSIWLLSEPLVHDGGTPLGTNATWVLPTVPFYWLGAGPQFINLFQITVLARRIPIHLLARTGSEPVAR